MFADVRTYWSADSVKRVTGYDIEGVAKDAGGFIHLINSGACCLDACGEVKDADGNGVIKPWYDVTDGDIEKMLAATTWNAADNGYFRGGGFSLCFDQSSDARYDDPSHISSRARPRSSDSRGLDCQPARRGLRHSLEENRLHLALHLVRSQMRRQLPCIQVGIRHDE